VIEAGVREKLELLDSATWDPPPRRADTAGVDLRVKLILPPSRSGWRSTTTSPAECPAVGPQRVDVGGYGVSIQVSGRGSPTVVFESGGGDNSSVWSSIEPELRERKAVETVLYDRAGLGNSEPKPGPYRIDDEVAALRTALSIRGVQGPIVLVAHSYGGFVSYLMAAEDPRVAGLVLVDANLPGFFDEAEVARLLARFTPLMDGLTRAHPKIAETMVPLTLALPATATRVRGASIPLSLPVIDIVAETTWVPSPEEIAAMGREHATFVAASPHREAVFASGSGHYVMKDRPEVVVDAVSRMIDRVRAVPIGR
jgi:pimeloyl-ACP methyl ester carboxylesterase